MMLGCAVDTNLQKGREQTFSACTKGTRFTKKPTIFYTWLAKKGYNIKEHFQDQGLVVREHGIDMKKCHNALTFAGILEFIENYVKQHAILLPGCIPRFKRDDVSVLPS